MQALNSLYVLILIPIFEEFIYPALARCNLLVKYNSLKEKNKIINKYFLLDLSIG